MSNRLKCKVEVKGILKARKGKLTSHNSLETAYSTLVVAEKPCRLSYTRFGFVPASRPHPSHSSNSLCSRQRSSRERCSLEPAQRERRAELPSTLDKQRLILSKWTIFPFFRNEEPPFAARLDQVWTASTLSLSISRQDMSQSFF